jgi:hypothetical protein
MSAILESLLTPAQRREADAADAAAYTPQRTPADPVHVDLSSARQAAAAEAMSALHSAQAKHPALAGTITQALALSKSPAERRVIYLQAEADRYAESVTRGMDATESQRRSVSNRYFIGLLTAAFLNATQDLGEALDLLENEARETFFDGRLVEQAGFEKAWFEEQPKLFREWKELQRRAERSF